MKKTLYQILGVKPDASREEIAAAYQAALENLARAPQADQNARMFLREAYQVLGNDAQRAAYDASLARPAAAAARTRAPAVDDEPPGSILEALAASGLVKWIVAAVVVAALAAWWWKSRQPAPKRGPTIVSRTTIIVPPASQAPAAAPSAAAAVPAPAEPARPAAARERSAEEIFDQVSGSVARVNVLDASGRPVATGSGVVIERETVLTNCHVANRGTQLAVKVGGDTLPATVSVADEELDLCRLRVSGLGAAAVEIGGVGGLRTGQKVFAIGAPQGLDLTISDGIVSALREVEGGTVIQTTAPISPGSSGGGLFNTAGQLVGIMTFQHRYGQNLNFALPADWIGAMQSRGRATAGAATTVAAASRSADPRALIVGNWSCFGPLTGRSGDYTFSADGQVRSVIEGRQALGRYTLQGKTLTLYDKITLAVLLESISAEKMVLKVAEGRRLACDRR
jgi:S1-C subfamily serine protease